MSPTTHRLGEVEIESLADARAFALTDDRRKKLLSEQFECTFCWTNSDSEPVALTEARRRPPRAGGHQIHPAKMTNAFDGSRACRARTRRKD